MTARSSSDDGVRDTAGAGPRAHPGLCSACKLGVACTYHRSLGLPVWQCEEFEGIEPPVGPMRQGASRHPLAPDVPAESDAEYTGLCRFCGNRASCSFPRPIGGVWHCLEFQ